MKQEIHGKMQKEEMQKNITVKVPDTSPIVISTTTYDNALMNTTTNLLNAYLMILPPSQLSKDGPNANSANIHRQG